MNAAAEISLLELLRVQGTVHRTILPLEFRGQCTELVQGDSAPNFWFRMDKAFTT
jgi:hypothetical protein